MRRLEGRVVLVTGASSGSGAAAARALVREGARVVLGARREQRLADLSDELGSEVAVHRRADVAVAEDVEQLVTVALQRFGRLDAAFANAGSGPGGTLTGGDVTQWPAIVLANVVGLAFTLRYASAAIRETAGTGSIVINSSIVGRRVTPGNPVYTASKFAAGALADAARLELGDDVRITVIESGAVATEFPRRQGERRLTAEDVAGVVVDCLACAPALTMEEIVVTAGSGTRNE
jgi:NADP-dependent 3-hydroxy acid dehydrogenase YdfG